MVSLLNQEIGCLQLVYTRTFWRPFVEIFIFLKNINLCLHNNDIEHKRVNNLSIKSSDKNFMLQYWKFEDLVILFLSFSFRTWKTVMLFVAKPKAIYYYLIIICKAERESHLFDFKPLDSKRTKTVSMEFLFTLKVILVWIACSM